MPPRTKKPPLDIQKEISQIRQQYKDDPRQHTFNALLMGEMGSGKTFIARTCRKPIFIDSFDPGGTKGLRDYIEKGDIVVDTRWESEDPKSPEFYSKWKRAFRERDRDGFFEHFGTYMLDSATTWSEAIMNDILRAAGVPGEAPRWSKDYVPQKMEIRNMLRRMLDLPCDFLLTGHLRVIEDPDGLPLFRFMTTGQGMITIPMMFDEVLVMEPKKSSTGVEYRILTKSTGRHLARSRLAADGKLNIYEPADITKLLKKAGFEKDDKPNLAD